jgi:PAS domain S-box-containing protein
MRGGIFRSVRNYIVLAAVIGIATALVSTILFTQDNLPWTSFLTGILVASVLAEAARASRSEWVLMRRTAQLSAIKEKFELESNARKRTEKKMADDQVRLRLIDELMSTMVVLVDAAEQCRYHNRAFRDWLHLKPEFIDGRHIRELLGPKSYAGLATAVRQTLDGQSLHYEHLQGMNNGALCRLSVEQIPQFDAAGKIVGLYFIADDITNRDDLHIIEKFDFSGNLSNKQSGGNAAQTQHPNPLAAKGEVNQAGEQRDQGRLFIAAIQHGEFCLYCQLISPLPINSGKTAHYEILIRLMEEEGGMIPPGGFFPMAEKTGLMPYLDRWVVSHVLEWAVNQKISSHVEDSLFFINVAAATIGDPEFPEFLQITLEELGVPGSVLCFEVSDADLVLRNNSTVEFIRGVRKCGCRVALCGFGRNPLLLDFIRGFQVEFLKIDGNTILNMLSNPAEFDKVVAISHTAKKIGVKTIAELVERDEIVAKLEEVGIDFAQGFGISRPRPLIE